MHGDLHTADAISQGVVKLAQHRRSTVVEAFDQSDRPQRTGPIEVGHRRHPGHFQYAVEVARLGGRHLAQVEIEVEVRSGLPPRRCRWRRLHHPLTPDRHFAR